MHRVLLNFKSEKDARYLKNYLETELPFEVTLNAGAGELADAIHEKKYHLLLLQTGDLTRQDLVQVQSLRKLGYVNPILMITDNIGELDIEGFHQQHKICFMERPFDLKTLKGVARKLINSRSVPQQIFRRYRTNIVTTLETFISGERFETQMFNLSRGGAYFELSKRPTVAVGDLLRLKVHLTDMEREHNVHGRVVWTTHKGHAAGGYGLGVKFMKSSDIYRRLLENV